MISKSAMTPSFMGRMATMFPGVRPSIILASRPTASTLLRVLAVFPHRHHRRLGEHDALPFDVHQGVGGAQIDGQIIGEPA